MNNEQDMHVLTKASETTALNSTLYIFFSTDLHTFIKILYIKKTPNNIAIGRCEGDIYIYYTHLITLSQKEFFEIMIDSYT